MLRRQLLESYFRLRRATRCAASPSSELQIQTRTRSLKLLVYGGSDCCQCARQLLTSAPATIILLGRDELTLLDRHEADAGIHRPA
jgi:hypothetical protein